MMEQYTWYKFRTLTSNSYTYFYCSEIFSKRIYGGILNRGFSWHRDAINTRELLTIERLNPFEVEDLLQKCPLEEFASLIKEPEKKRKLINFYNNNVESANLV